MCVQYIIRTNTSVIDKQTTTTKQQNEWKIFKINDRMDRKQERKKEKRRENGWNFIYKSNVDKKEAKQQQQDSTHSKHIDGKELYIFI